MSRLFGPSREWLTQQLWALSPSALQAVIDQSGAEIELAAVAPRPIAARREGSIAVIPVHGIIEHRASLMGALMGGASVDGIRSAFREAMASPDVVAVVLDMDSPGGEVQGIPELAAEIRASRGTKPIYAVANGTMASAAYWIGSQADKVYATPSGEAGSIGILSVHQEASKALSDEGVTTTIISAGEHKADITEFSPLTEDARDHLQHRAETLYGMFVGDVAKGRGITPEAVRSGYGQGRMLLAADAAKAGLVDGVATLDEVIRQVARASRATSVRAMRAASDGPLETATVEVPEPPEDPWESMPFGLRVHELDSLVAHARVRADLRAKEGRPAFSAPTTASLRSIRDALTELLPADPAEAAHAQAPAVEPPAPEASVVPEPKPAPVPQRFAAPGSWDRYVAQETSFR